MRPIPLLLFSVLLLLGCDDEELSMTMGNPPPRPAADTTVSYLALGDSYTIGTAVGAADRWPAQLAQALAAEERIRVEPLEIVARNGWRTDNLANALAAGPPGNDFDLVSLLIGVNDQYQGFSVRGYTLRFEQLLRSSIAYAGGDTSNVFIVSIPDYAYTPFGGGSQEISDDIARFNAAAAEVAGRYGVTIFDITEISRGGLDDPELLSSDRLHPSGKQYKRWVDEVLLSGVTALLRD